MPQNFYELVWIFIIYAFIGWCTEVSYAALDTGKFVNRGFLNGPYCPIYGCGVVIVVAILTPLKENLLILFAGSFLLTSVLELSLIHICDGQVLVYQDLLAMYGDFRPKFVKVFANVGEVMREGVKAYITESSILKQCSSPGNVPSFVSLIYALTPSRITSPTFANTFTNFGRKSPYMASRSW